MDVHEKQAKRARSIWLEPHPDMAEVESMYRSSISSFLQDGDDPTATITGGGTKRPLATGDIEEVDKEKDCERDQSGGGSCCSSSNRNTSLQDWQRLALEQLCMILCQSGRSKEAKLYLCRLGYVCRLATGVLDYKTTTIAATKVTGNAQEPPITKKSASAIACHIWDNFLSEFELQHLRRVFADRQADYWIHHNYQVEPPSPYFSYVVPLIRTKTDTATSVSVGDEFGCLGDIISNLHQHLLPYFPKLSASHMVEFWAHNREHPTGHQFHFDSDNEGQGRMIKNPIMTAILYLPTAFESSSSSSENAGGPSVVTNQALVSQHLATKAVMSVSTSPGRLLAFDGSLLHGVIPGKGSHSGTRRVTLMLAFWKRIRIRPGDTPGAARPYPFPTSPPASGDDADCWNELLVRSSHLKNDADDRSMLQRPTPIPRDPIPLDRVYETLDGQKWTKAMGFPEYDQVFQGF